MSNYSGDPAMVRVDFFRESGNWYTTEAVKWTGKWSADYNIYKEFALSLRNHFISNPQRLSGMDAICLDPYHEHSHPIQLKNGSWIKG